MNGTRIIVVDDDKDDFKTLSDAFEIIGAGVSLQHVVESCDLLNLLEIDPDALPDLIVLDLNMPKVDGFLLLESLKSQSRLKHIPVVVYSTCSDLDQIKKCYHLGAAAYITKPCLFGGILEVASELADIVSGAATHQKTVSVKSKFSNQRSIWK